ncbi:MAG TPA: formate dehydrogenase accessory protein FdhE [Chloroflexota bacterium]|nr:formate dehydrogenase accessory protein FdhE [Chloroflexota bacterium]
MSVAPEALELERLAATDPAVAPLARLQGIALRAAADPAWAEGVPDLTEPRAESAAPRLQGARLLVDADRLRALLGRLAASLDSGGPAAAARLGPLFASPALEPAEVLRASLVHDDAALEAVAATGAADPAVLAVVAQAAALPLLAACSRRAAEALAAESWPHGYCPTCAAWPTLAEVRGLARELILRCGRCGSGWPFEHRRCPYCGNREQHRQRYFAPEQEREIRRAVTCDRCQGYVKTQATLGPLRHPEILVRDLESLELDVTALAHGYRRPEGLGWALSLAVEAAPRRGGWWRRR